MQFFKLLDHRLIKQTNLSIIFRPFWIYLFLIIDKLPGGHCFYISDHHYLLDYQMKVFDY